MTQPHPDPIPHSHPDVSAADDTQVVYYQGSPKLRGDLGPLFLWLVVGLAIAVAPILLRAYTSVHVVWWAIAVGILVGLLCCLVPALMVRREFFRVTNYRIDFEQGLLFKNYNTIELWHVEDVSLHQSPIDRVFQVGTLTIASRDMTTPRLVLRGVSNPVHLLETLKTRIIAVKRQQGVLKVDPG